MITIDLLGKACDVDYGDAVHTVVTDVSLGEPIPFASIGILIRTKDTIREADRRDREFLEALLKI